MLKQNPNSNIKFQIMSVEEGPTLEALREQVGRMVRDEWCQCKAEELRQGLNVPSHHLTRWEHLDEANKEIDRRIGMRIVTAQTFMSIPLVIEQLGQYIHSWAIGKGFWEKERNCGEMLMLMVTEIAETMEWLRKPEGTMSDHMPEFTGEEEEMADTIIRILDYSMGRKLRIGEAVMAKMAYNETRPHKHGKTC